MLLLYAFVYIYSSSSSIKIIESFLVIRKKKIMHLFIPNSLIQNKNQVFFLIKSKELFIMRFSYIFLITYALNAIKVN